MKNSGWRKHCLKDKAPTRTADEDASEAAKACALALLTVEDVVASGHIWDTASDEYKKFWDFDEWPHPRGRR